MKHVLKIWELIGNVFQVSVLSGAIQIKKI